MFRFFYLTAAWLLWLAAVPVLLLASLFKPKLRQPLFKRLLLWKNPPFSHTGIWFHAASFGEVRALKPLVTLLSPSEKVNISVATETGFAEAVRLYPQAQVRFLPFENWLPLWVRPQKALIVFDAELWFALFDQAKRTGAKTALFNARVPDKSLETYHRLHGLFGRIFSKIDLVFAQSAIDRARLAELGASHADLLGNIKLLQAPQITRRFAKPEALTTTAASTHKGEELLITAAWLHSQIGGRLLIVPRHPPRFDEAATEIEAFCRSHNLGFERFSQSQRIGIADVTLVDAMGLLNDIYAVSDIVVLGGAFTPRGGHNPLEPAHFGCRLITGLHHDLQKPLFAALDHVLFTDEHRLADTLKTALNQPGATLKTPLDTRKLQEALSRVVG